MREKYKNLKNEYNVTLANSDNIYANYALAYDAKGHRVPNVHHLDNSDSVRATAFAMVELAQWRKVQQYGYNRVNDNVKYIVLTEWEDFNNPLTPVELKNFILEMKKIGFDADQIKQTYFFLWGLVLTDDELK